MLGSYKTYKNKYIDLLIDAWYDNYVGFTTKENIFEGYDDNSFKPEINMTRAEFVTAVVRFLKLEHKDNNYSAFKDTKGKWYSNDVDTMAYYGYINGYSDGTFRGDKSITRAE